MHRNIVILLSLMFAIGFAFLVMLTEKAKPAEEGYQVTGFEKGRYTLVYNKGKTKKRLVISCAPHQLSSHGPAKGADSCHLPVGEHYHSDLYYFMNLPKEEQVKHNCRVVRSSDKTLNVQCGQTPDLDSQLFIILEEEVVPQSP